MQNKSIFTKPPIPVRNENIQRDVDSATAKIGENTARLWGLERNGKKNCNPADFKHTYFCTIIWDVFISKVSPGDLNLLPVDLFISHTIAANH